MNYLIDKLTNDKLVKKWCIGELMHGYLIMINGCLQATSWLIRNNSTEPIPSTSKDSQFTQTAGFPSSPDGESSVVAAPSLRSGVMSVCRVGSAEAEAELCRHRRRWRSFAMMWVISGSLVTSKYFNWSVIVCSREFFLACLSRYWRLYFFCASWASSLYIPLGSGSRSMFLTSAPCMSTWCIEAGMYCHGYNRTYDSAVPPSRTGVFFGVDNEVPLFVKCQSEA